MGTIGPVMSMKRGIGRRWWQWRQTKKDGWEEATKQNWQFKYSTSFERFGKQEKKRLDRISSKDTHKKKQGRTAVTEVTPQVHQSRDFTQ